MQEYLRRLLKDKARLRKWKRVMIALSCIVVVCTVYALSLPAQTLTCDKEEHTHTAECYDENNELICEKEEHTHTDDCNKQEEVNEQEEVVRMSQKHKIMRNRYLKKVKKRQQLQLQKLQQKLQNNRLI